MTLTIDGTRTIGEMQQDFNAAYPYLKIEFFKSMNGRSGQPSIKNMLSHSLKIKEARRQQHDGSLELSDMMKVGDLEKIFREQYGLNVQVFRKSANVWLETTMTDTWTLKQQNDHGREISTSF